MDVVSALVTAGIVALIAGLSWAGSRSARRDDAHPDRVRMPRVVLWIGVGGLPLMLIILAASFGSGDPAMTVVPLLLIGVFGFLILLYANWWLVLEPNRLTFRTALGRVRTIRYVDVTHVRVVRRYNATQLSLRAADGTRFSINPGTFDVSPLLQALQEQGWDLSVRRWRP